MTIVDESGIVLSLPKVCMTGKKATFMSNDYSHCHVAMRNYEVQVKAYADQLERLIAQSEDQPIIANQYFHWFSFDVMGQVAFSKDFNMLRSAQWHSAIKVFRDGLAMLGPLTPVPWLVCMGPDIPVGSSRDLKNMVRFRRNSLPTYFRIRMGICATRG